MTRNKPISNVPLLLTAFSASVTTGGAIYAFGVYGDAMKKSLQLTQLQLDTISAAMFVAGLFSWIPGLVVDRCGTRFSLILGGTAGAAFSTLYWAFCKKWIPIPNHHHQNHLVVAILCANGVAICLSCALIVGSMFKITVVCAGPGTRGTAVGIAKGLVGLGAGIYASLYQALRQGPSESALDFLPVTAVCFILCVVVPATCLLPRRTSIRRENLRFDMTPLHFRVMYGSLAAISIVIVSASILELMQQHQQEEGGNADDDKVNGTVVASSDGPNYARALLIVAIWLGPIWGLLLLPRQEQTESLASTNDNVDEIDEEHSTPDEQTPLSLNPKQFLPQSTRGHALVPETDNNLNLPQMLQTTSAWLMLWTTAILVGSGTYKTNNMGEMVEALGFNETVVPSTLALFSVAQAFARVLTGVVSERTLHVKSIRNCGVPAGGLPRPFYLVVASLIALVSHCALALATTEWFFVTSCVVSGLAFGMAWPLMVLIVGEVFGLEHHGANYMFFDGGTKALGTVLLSDYLAGSVYQAHIRDDSKQSYTCVGIDCFQTTHLVVAGLALTCVVASFALQFTSRHVYGGTLR